MPHTALTKVLHEQRTVAEFQLKSSAAVSMLLILIFLTLRRMAVSASTRLKSLLMRSFLQEVSTILLPMRRSLLHRPLNGMRPLRSLMSLTVIMKPRRPCSSRLPLLLQRRDAQSENLESSSVVSLARVALGRLSARTLNTS